MRNASLIKKKKNWSKQTNIRGRENDLKFENWLKDRMSEAQTQCKILGQSIEKDDI